MIGHGLGTSVQVHWITCSIEEIVARTLVAEEEKAVINQVISEM